MSDLQTSVGGHTADVSGFITTYRVWHDRPMERIHRKPNQRQVGWGQIVARSLMGDRNFRLRAMYIEFVNTPGSSLPWSAPSYDAYEGIEYYEDLSLTADQDFLRVPLAAEPSQRIVTGYEGYFADDGTEGNMLRFFAQTQGGVGIHGKTFSAAAGSVVVGAALVAVPDWSDRQQDWIFARSYLASDKQQEASDNYAVGLGWDIGFLIS